MGQVAHRALKQIAERGGVAIGGDQFIPATIGLGRERERLAAYAAETGLEHFFTDAGEAIEAARTLNPRYQIYHNVVATGSRLAALDAILPQLDPSTTAVFCEKPVASNYAEGLRIVESLEKGRFLHGVVHDMIQAPGIREAIRLIPRIRPLHCNMVFGYEVGPGLSDNAAFRGQRPDFNWVLAQAGGGIILDMCHEAYVSHALFGATRRLSAIARRFVPVRRSAVSGERVPCDVEDYAAIRREHAGGVVNHSLWTWMRRVNSEFGPLEITVDGTEGTIVFGLHGLKVQWKESAPALHWKDSLEGKPIAWRDFWAYPEIERVNPFGVELERFIRCLVLREPYPYSATIALDWLGEVEAIYDSAARNGQPIEHDHFRHYPDPVPEGWQPERLQSLFGAPAGGAA